MPLYAAKAFIMNKLLTIEGHAIVSKNGMIADYKGDMPPFLNHNRDFEIFQHHLDEAALVVLGSKGHAKHENHKKRRRLVVTSKVNRLRSINGVTHWNPMMISFDELLIELEISAGIIAITGGNRVFDLFLEIGFDSFLLSEVQDVIPNGIPCFSKGFPRDVLKEKGLTLLSETPIGEGVLSSLWCK